MNKNIYLIAQPDEGVGVWPLYFTTPQAAMQWYNRVTKQNLTFTVDRTSIWPCWQANDATEVIALVPYANANGTETDGWHEALATWEEHNASKNTH